MEPPGPEVIPLGAETEALRSRRGLALASFALARVSGLTVAAATLECVSDEVQLSFSLPLDLEGFLRRECPTCEREFKWLPARPDLKHAGGETATTAPDTEPAEVYYCPYCAVTAPPDAWFTKAQVASMHNLAHHELIDPELEKLEREIKKLNRSSGGFLEIEARLERDEPLAALPLDEPDDMRRVDFTCHRDEPVKVLDEWDRPVHCLVCGEAASS
jgi:hypothetical protein